MQWLVIAFARVWPKGETLAVLAGDRFGDLAGLSGDFALIPGWGGPQCHGGPSRVVMLKLKRGSGPTWTGCGCSYTEGPCVLRRVLLRVACNGFLRA